MRVDLFRWPARWKVALFRTPARWQVWFVARDREREVDLPTPEGWFSFWPWGRREWPCVVTATVQGFPPGRPFTARDLRAALPPWVRAMVSGGYLGATLGRLWEGGTVVKVRPRYWAVPAHPDFSPRQWQAFLERARRERGQPAWPGHQEELSVAYHVHLWQRRILAAESRKALKEVGRLIRQYEPNPEVRQRLRPLYRERAEELEGGESGGEEPGV